MLATYEAIIQGNPEKALDIFRLKFRGFQNNPVELFNFARLLDEFGHRDELSTVCKLLLASPAHCFYAAYQTGAGLVSRGASPEAAAAEACVLAAQGYRPVIAALLHSRASKPAAALAARHIAICGTAYCGSTLLDHMFNGLDGVRSVGESHWLANSFSPGPLKANDYLDPLKPSAQHCFACGTICQVLSPEFRVNLAADPRDWYFKIAKRLQADVLVSADKNLPKLVLNDPKLRLDALVLFKSPKQAWASVFSKQPAGLGAEELHAKLLDFMGKWRNTYAQMLSLLTPKGRKIFVNFDQLTINPESQMRRITAELSLPFEMRMLQQLVPGHSIGGNRRIYLRLIASNYGVAIQPLGVPDIPGDHAAWIDQQSDHADLLNAMQVLAGPVAHGHQGHD